MQDPTRKVGEIDLTIAFTYDPAASSSGYDIEYYEKLMRQASVMLCDATEGRFRIGNVRFVRSAGGRLGADIFAFDYADTSHSLPPNISANGTHVDLYRPDPMTVAHELGHYVFGLGDQYGTSFPPGPCRHGDGFDSAPDSVNTSMMEFSNYSPYCCTRTNSGEDWSVHSMQSCGGVEDCFQLAEDLGIPVIWGRGPEDTVRCDNILGTELSSLENHDLFNGLGAGFDRRTTDGTWGFPGWGTTHKEQLELFTNMQLACTTPDCVIDHCPSPRGTQSITATVRLFDGDSDQTPLSGVPEVGDIVSLTDAESLAVVNRQVPVKDNIGRWYNDNRDANACPTNQDSNHTLHVYLQNIEPAAEIRGFGLWNDSD